MIASSCQHLNNLRSQTGLYVHYTISPVFSGNLQFIYASTDTRSRFALQMNYEDVWHASCC